MTSYNTIATSETYPRETASKTQVNNNVLQVLQERLEDPSTKEHNLFYT